LLVGDLINHYIFRKKTSVKLVKIKPLKSFFFEATCSLCQGTARLKGTDASGDETRATRVTYAKQKSILVYTIPRIAYSENREFSLCRLFVPKKMSSSSNSEKEISPHSSEVLEDVNKRVQDVFDILNRETNRVRKEMEALDEAAKKLEHVHFSKMLKLNVGGHLFSTSLATLNKDPGDL